MNKPGYYISTGLLNNYYTLRYVTIDVGQQSAGDGIQPTLTSVTRDYHVQNLSTDKDEAIAKAKVLVGKMLSADFDVIPIGQREEVDWSIFQSGKHRGESIHEVIACDKDYVLFMLENQAGSKNYGKTLEYAAALLADELKVRAEKRKKAAEKADRRIGLAKRLLAPVAKELRLSGGPFCLSVASDLEAGVCPFGRGRATTIDIFAKGYGRRNSAAYNAAFDNASRRLSIAEKCRA